MLSKPMLYVPAFDAKVQVSTQSFGKVSCPPASKVKKAAVTVMSHFFFLRSGLAPHCLAPSHKYLE